MQASPYQAAKHTVRYKHDLFFTLTRIWKFLDAHFTKKNTKAVHINLKAIIIKYMTLLISCVLITKGVKVTREGGTREFKIDDYR